MHGPQADTGRATVPGLLPWQFGVLGFAAGILALRWPGPAWLCLILIFFFSRAALGGFRLRAAVALCFLLGWGAALWALPASPGPAPGWMSDRETALVRGRVERVEPRPDGVLRVFLSHADYALDDGRAGPLPGLVLWNWKRPLSTPAPGAEARVRLRLAPVRGFANPGGWDTVFHWRRQGVFVRGWTRGEQGAPAFIGGEPGPMARLREAMRAAVLGDGPPDRGRALVAALVLGDRQHLDHAIVDALRAASLGHSLALSGLHLGFAAALGFGLAWLAGRVAPSLYLRLPRTKLGVLLALPCAGFYLWLGGATPSLVRAGVMLASWGLLLWLDRERPLLDGLFLAVLLILGASPLSLYDMRLQFSVVAVAGIAVLGPPLWRLVPRPGRTAGLMRRALLRALAASLGVLIVSAAACAALLPLTAWYFGEAAPSLWVNVFWLPMLGVAGVPLGLAGAVAAVVPGLEWAGRALLVLDAAVLSACADGVLALREAGWLPVATLMRPPGMQILGLYALAAGGVVFARTRSRAALAAGMLALALLVWPWAAREWSGADRSLRLTLLDVGQGQAVLIETPGGGRTLVDGGGPWSPTFDVGRAVVVPALTLGRLPRLERVVLTHPDGDHYRGLVHVLEGCAVGLFAHDGRWPEGEGGCALRAAVEANGAPVEVWRAGRRVELAPGVVLEVLHPADVDESAEDNDASLVLRLTWEGRGLALVCGDVEQPGLKALLARGASLNAEVVVLPHHGSRTSLSEEFYALAAPRLALAATGSLNYLGLPHVEVREALAARGIPLLDTGTFGQVRVAWDAPEARARVETELVGPR